MTIFKSISHSQSLLQDIANNNKSDNTAEITRLITSLSAELDKIHSLAQQLADDAPIAQASQDTPELQSGCYVFANEKGFFCPRCYDNLGNKVATTRINKKLRVCPACRTGLK